MAPTTSNTRLNSALARAAVYEALAHALAYPDAVRVQAVNSCGAALATTDLPLPLLRFAVLAREAVSGALEPVHVALNTLSSSPDCPAYESAYVSGDPQQQTQRMADIAGFYRAFGVDATAGGYRPDELSVELEFMAFLCQKEAYAEGHLGPPRARQARKAQRIFLEHHLGRWAGALGERLAASAPPGHFYHATGQALAWWLEEELALARVQPQPLAATPALPQWPEPVSHGPEFAGAASFIPVEAMSVR